MAEYHRTLEINGRYLTVEVVGVLQSQLVAGLGFTTWLIYFFVHKQILWVQPKGFQPNLRMHASLRM